MPASTLATGVIVREAVPDDNSSLLALDAACRMGTVPAWTIRHAPDFFALFRVARVRAQVGIAVDADGATAGAVTILEQPTMDHQPPSIWYVSGWQVHPRFRGHSVGPALVRWALDRCQELGGPGATGWFMSGGSGRALCRLVSRVAPALRVGSPRPLRSYRLRTAHWRSLVPSPAFVVRPARPFDIDEMADLWCRVAATRRLAPRLDAAELERWRATVFATPPACYWVAHTPMGSILGFMGLWDQRAVKQFHLEAELGVTVGRRVVAHVRGALAGERTADGGVTVPDLAVTHCCAAPAAARVQAVLLARAARAAWLGGFRHITAMVDVADPLARVCERWAGASHPFAACVAGPPNGIAVDGRDHLPLHQDIGLA